MPNDKPQTTEIEGTKPKERADCDVDSSAFSESEKQRRSTRQPQTTIFRIQDKDGRGPYKPGFSKNWCDEDARCLIAAPLVAPYMDEFPEVQDKIESVFEMFGGHFGCGFRTRTQLHRGFTSDEIKKLLRYGYSIVEIMPDMVLAESINQLVFWCKKPLARTAKILEAA